MVRQPMLVCKRVKRGSADGIASADLPSQHLLTYCTASPSAESSGTQAIMLLSE